VIAALDSSFDAPSAADADAARAQGVRVWGGYLSTRAGVDLAAPWPRGAFDAARRCGGTPLAFCSGWDDPKMVRLLAAEWDVRPCLDVEPGIRGDGSWVDAWLAASGAGLYGLLSVHHHAAPFRIAALYPGSDPERTWPIDVVPAEPCGWQWRGTHRGPGGRSVDALYLDDWFAPPVVAPTHKEEETAMPLVIDRADGGKDWFAIVGGQLHHVALDAFGAAHFNDLVPGAWAVLQAGGWDGPSLWVRGLGVDGGLWRSTWTDGVWSQPVSGLS
jgi:hypothetical protein